MVLLLIGAAFFIGNLSARVSYLERSGAVRGDTTANQNLPAGQNQPAAAPAPAEIDKETFKKLAEGEHVIGKKNAKVAIVEFSDFQCPFCKSFFDATFSQIKKDYIDTGKVKLVYRQFPLTAIHPYAMGAALAAECASEQGKFEAYHDKLFANQTSLTTEDLKNYASQVGLNTGKFNSCLDSQKYKDKVDADTKLGTDNGINGTPGFFVNGKLVSGAQPYENFKMLLDEALRS